MANIRDLKKDINYVLGDIIDAVYVLEAATDKQDSDAGSAIIDDAIETFDTLMAEVNQKDVENPKQHYKSIRKKLEEQATGLIDRLNQLG